VVTAGRDTGIVARVDVCVVTYRNTADRVAGALRPQDRLHVRDNTDENIGFAAGANSAAAQGSDQLLAFVNPDGDPHPGCFAALEQALKDPEVVAVEATLEPPMPRPLDERGDPPFLFATCLAVRRRPFEEVGGFDGRLFMYYEDIDLSYKLLPYGRLRITGDAVFSHDVTPRPFRAKHRLWRNHLVVERRHRRAPHTGLLVQSARDAVGVLRLGQRDVAAARFTAALDYVVRAHRWVDRPLLMDGARAPRAGSAIERPRS
jgi:GT2 family glycosyltransferase